MEAREFRVGNLIFINDSIRTIEGVVGDQVWYKREGFLVQDTCSGSRPIPLTEEWLLRMGGEEDIIGGVKIGHRLCNIWVWGNNIMLWDGIDYSSAYTHLKYVHQLQNLYYSLTGTELTIKG